MIIILTGVAKTSIICAETINVRSTNDLKHKMKFFISTLWLIFDFLPNFFMESIYAGKTLLNLIRIIWSHLHINATLNAMQNIQFNTQVYQI